MRASHSFAIALAAFGAVLWLALDGFVPDDPLQADLRPAEVEAPSDPPGGTAELSAVPVDERRRAPKPPAEEPETPPGAPEESRLSITGFVRADATFSPQAVTTVWAHRPGAEEEEEAQSVRATSRPPRAWAFESLPPDTWVFTAFVVEGERFAVGSVGPVDARAGTPPVVIDALEFVVAGVVTDSEGRPLPEIGVELWWTSSEPNGLPSRHFPPRFAEASKIPRLSGGLSENVPRADAQQAMTDHTGRFRFAVAGPGTVKLEAPESDRIGWELTYPGFTFSDSKIDERVLSLGNLYSDALTPGPARPKMIELVEEAELQGELRQTLLASKVELETARGERSARTRELLASTLEAAAALYVEPSSDFGDSDFGDSETIWLPLLVEDQLTAAKPKIDDLVLELQRSASLSGRLRADGGEPEGIDCFLRFLSADAPKGAPRQRHVSPDGNGAFTFRGCAPGEYFLYARCGGAEGQDFSLRLELILGEGEERFIDDRLTASARINGVVLDREGRPLAGVDVRATGRRNSNLTRRATTDASGMYTLVGLYEGDYELTLDNNRVEKALTIEVPAGGAVLQADPLVAADI